MKRRYKRELKRQLAAARLRGRKSRARFLAAETFTEMIAQLRARQWLDWPHAPDNFEEWELGIRNNHRRWSIPINDSWESR